MNYAYILGFKNYSRSRHALRYNHKYWTFLSHGMSYNAKKPINCSLLLCYFIILFYHMLIFSLHCQLILCISGSTKICYLKTRSNVKFSLYLKKTGLASRNIVHLQKNHPTLCRFLLSYFSF